MKKEKIIVSYEHYDSMDELQSDDRKLMLDAFDASLSAYAPYSDFKVGAAVLLENGSVIKGSNQENAAYPSGLCAERVALFSAGSHFRGIKIKTIAVAAFKGNDLKSCPAGPCGACRQVIAEYEHLYNQNIRVIMMTEGHKIAITESSKSLLPFLFNADNLI